MTALEFVLFVALGLGNVTAAQPVERVFHADDMSQPGGMAGGASDTGKKATTGKKPTSTHSRSARRRHRPVGTPGKETANRK